MAKPKPKSKPKSKITTCSQAGHFLNPYVKANKATKSKAGAKLAIC